MEGTRRIGIRGAKSWLFLHGAGLEAASETRTNVLHQEPRGNVEKVEEAVALIVTYQLNACCVAERTE